MSSDLIELLGDQIAGHMARAEQSTDEQLLQAVAAWLDAQSRGTMFSGTPQDRFRHWVDTALVPALRRFGDAGTAAWDTLHDPESVFSKDRVAGLVICLAVMFGLQKLDVATAVTIVTLAVRYKSKPT